MRSASQRNETLRFCPQPCQISTDFQTSFTNGLGGKFVTKCSPKISPYCKHVATPTCEIIVYGVEQRLPFLCHYVVVITLQLGEMLVC